MSSLEPFRFLHTGDLHLDSPIEGLSAEAPPDVLAELRAATTGAWHNIVALALRERVDFVVIAGDVFEVASPTLLGQTRFRDGLARLADAGIPSFVVHGNHDPADGRSWAPSLVFPALAHRFGTGVGESVGVLREGREIARVHGRSYPRAAVAENFAASMKAGPDEPFSIGLLHTNVGDRPGHANYAPCSVSDLRSSGMDYWALGHIHHPGPVLDEPPALYCGIPQGRDPGELGARGCYLVEVGVAGQVTP
ncbi:MAG: metallophosphoesterase family protein, partial [Candidatus Limnocylindria bacterium]